MGLRVGRIRTIKPEFQNSESMGRVSRDARLLFILMWPQADDAGRLRANPRMLASILFPFDEDAASLLPKWLDELENERCILRYVVDNTQYVQITHWNHQKIDKPTASKLPAPPQEKRTKPRTYPREHSPTAPGALADRSPLEGKGRGRDQGKDQGRESCDEAKPLTQDESTQVVVITIPTNTPGEEFSVSQAFSDEMSNAYPATDVAAALKRIRAWAVANPKLCKTPGGMKRFINLWLAKEQDRSRSPAANGFHPTINLDNL